MKRSVLAALALTMYTSLHGYDGTRLDALLFLDWLLQRRPRPPTLNSMAERPAKISSGPWHLAWDGAGLTVWWEPDNLAWAGNGTPLLHTLAGTPFVAAAASERVAAEARGCFFVRDRVLVECVAQRVDAATATAGELQLVGGFDDCPGAHWRLRLTPDAVARHVSVSLEVQGAAAGGGALNRVQLGLGAPAGVAFWGMGAQFTHFNLRGHCVPAFVSEQGIFRGAAETQPWSWLLNTLGHGGAGNEYTTYASSASYVASAGYALALLNTEPALFDFGSVALLGEGVPPTAPNAPPLLGSGRLGPGLAAEAARRLR